MSISKTRKRHQDNDGSCTPKKRRKRSVKRNQLIVRDNNGKLREIEPNDTLWYQLYVLNGAYNDHMAQKFRLRFRMSFDSFISLYNEIKVHGLFSRWSNTDATFDSSSNMKLLLLGFLRHIGRSWTLDDIEEANGISREVNRIFLHTILEYGSTVLYKKWVTDPVVVRDISEQEKLFQIAGFDGCIGSTDATHVPILSCPVWASNMNKGFKLNLPSRTYNVTVDHSRRIICSTTGHPATWNDKTLVLYDPLLTKVKDRKLYDDYEFMKHHLSRQRIPRRYACKNIL